MQFVDFCNFLVPSKQRPQEKYLAVLPPLQAYKSCNSGKIPDKGISHCLWGAGRIKEVEHV